MNSGLNSEVLNLFYSIQDGLETILFYSIQKRRSELFRSCSNRRLGPMSKRWITVWCTNLIRFLYESTVNCFKMDLSATLSPTLIKRIHYWHFWTPSDPFQTTPDTVGPSLRRSKNYSNYSWIVLNSAGLNYSIPNRIDSRWDYSIRNRIDDQGNYSSYSYLFKPLLDTEL